jgi:hypothetical protein
MNDSERAASEPAACIWTFLISLGEMVSIVKKSFDLEIQGKAEKVP